MKAVAAVMQLTDFQKGIGFYYDKLIAAGIPCVETGCPCCGGPQLTDPDNTFLVPAIDRGLLVIVHVTPDKGSMQ